MIESRIGHWTLFMPPAGYSGDVISSKTALNTRSTDVEQAVSMTIAAELCARRTKYRGLHKLHAPQATQSDMRTQLRRLLVLAAKRNLTASLAISPT